MENQPKLNSTKEVIAFLAERFPQCFSAEGEARPLKIGIFQDLVERVQGEMSLSKTQLRSALRLYTSSWRYLYGIKAGATRVDLDGNACGQLDEQHVEHARKQLEEAKARVQAQREQQQAKKREAGEETTPRRPRKPVRKPAVEGSRRAACVINPLAPSQHATLPPRAKSPGRSNLNRLLTLQHCKWVKASKSPRVKMRWTQPFLRSAKMASGFSLLPAWQ